MTNLPQKTSEQSRRFEPTASNENSIEYYLELDDFDRLMIKMIASYPDIKSTKLAKIFNTTESFIRLRRKKPAFRLALQKILATTDSLLEEAAQKAARKLIELIDHENPAISLAAVKIALTRHLNSLPDTIKDRIIAYKTSITPDGTLLQEIVKEEISGHIIKAEYSET
jgi:hypothetical protein